MSTYKIEEGPGASISGGVGYSETYKFELNGNYTDANFLGTGQRVSVNLSTGLYNKVYGISETNPYTNVDNLTRTYSFSFRDVLAVHLDPPRTSRPRSSPLGESFGYPLSEYQFINLGVNLQGVQLVAIENSSALQSCSGCRTTAIPTMARPPAWCSIRPRPPTPTVCYYLDGTRFAVGQLVGGLELRFAQPRLCSPIAACTRRLSVSATRHRSRASRTTRPIYEFLKYIPLFGRFTLAFTGDLGYGDGLGSAKCHPKTDITAAYCVDPSLPPYELFYGGGPDSVRGFQESRLGPKDQYGNPYGGNLNILLRPELIIPMPAKIASSARVSLFVDVGNVFSTGKVAAVLCPAGPAPPYPPNQCGYSCGNVTQAELSMRRP